MRTEDLLAACLEARAQGQAPAEILETQATAEQRAELESLLALVNRLESLTPPRRAGHYPVPLWAAEAPSTVALPRHADLGSAPEVHRAVNGWLVQLCRSLRPPDDLKLTA